MCIRDRRSTSFQDSTKISHGDDHFAFMKFLEDSPDMVAVLNKWLLFGKN